MLSGRSWRRLASLAVQASAAAGPAAPAPALWPPHLPNAAALQRPQLWLFATVATGKQAAASQQPPADTLPWAHADKLPAEADVLNRQLTLYLRSASTLQQLVKMAGRELLAFNAVHTVTALTRLLSLAQGPATLGRGAPAGQLLEQLLQMLSGQVGQCDTRALASALWALARSEYATPVTDQLLAELQANNYAKLRRASPIDVSCIAWSLGKLRGTSLPDKQLLRCMDLMADIYAARRGEFKPQEICNLLWACAELYYPAESPLVDQLSQDFARLMHVMDGEAVSAGAFALAKMKRIGATDKAFFAAAANRMVALLQAPPGSAASAAAAAAAEAGGATSAPAAAPAAASPAGQIRGSRAQPARNRNAAYPATPSAPPKQQAPHTLSNVVWACHLAGCYDSRLLAAVASSATPQLHKYTPQGVSMLFEAFCSARHFDQQLFAAATAYILDSGSKFDAIQAQRILIKCRAWGEPRLQPTVTLLQTVVNNAAAATPPKQQPLKPAGSRSADGAAG